MKSPLTMKDGKDVRTIEELQEFFYLPNVVEEFRHDRLVEWLEDHYENELAEQVGALDKGDAKLEEKLQNIFDRFFEGKGPGKTTPPQEPPKSPEITDPVPQVEPQPPEVGPVPHPSSPPTPKLEGKVDRAAIAEVVKELEREIKEFRKADSSEGRLYSPPEDLTFCDPIDYNKGAFTSEAEAKFTCRQAVDTAVQEAKKNYAEERKKVIAAAKAHYDPLIKELADFVEAGFFSLLGSFAASRCSESTLAYLRFKLDEFTSAGGNQRQEIDAAWEESFSVATKAVFEEELLAPGIFSSIMLMPPVGSVLSMIDVGKLVDIEELLDPRKLFHVCEFSYDGRSYSFKVERVCVRINWVLKHNTKVMARRFPHRLEEEYDKIKKAHVDRLAQWVAELKEQPKGSLVDRVPILGKRKVKTREHK